MKEGFNDYLNRVRINKACNLLKDTKLPISEIGSQVGYADHSYFCRVFKKITGRTPSEWKRL
jgi:two-component system response regulator YesN